MENIPAGVPGESPGRRFGVLFWLTPLILLGTVLAGAFFLGPGYFHDPDYWLRYVFGRVAVFVLAAIILCNILAARRTGAPFVRRIPGLTAIDETVGRATEMGRPITFSLGLSQKLDIVSLQALAIALHVVRLAIQFGTRVIVTMRLPILYAIAEEAIAEAYAAAGRPESFNREDVRFLSDRQFAYASAMMGTIIRERAASNYMFGEFYAESLILAEAGNHVGAIQVAGTPSTTQVPFFVASCDYTIIGDEFYAATAYLTRDPVLCGSLVGQDRAKMLLLGVIVIGLLLVTSFSLNADPAVQAWSKTVSGMFTNAR